MPNYSTTGLVKALYPGDSETVWSAATVAITDASQQVALASGPWTGSTINIAVELKFAADPGAFQIDLQTADTDAAADYVNESSASFTAVNATFAARAEIQVQARFARLLVTTGQANAAALTAKISR